MTRSIVNSGDGFDPKGFFRRTCIIHEMQDDMEPGSVYYDSEGVLVIGPPQNEISELLLTNYGFITSSDPYIDPELFTSIVEDPTDVVVYVGLTVPFADAPDASVATAGGTQLESAQVLAFDMVTQFATYTVGIASNPIP